MEARNPPRNHFSIPLADRARRDVKPIYHDRLDVSGQADAALTGVIELVIDILAPVHVGTGAFTLHEDRLVKDLVRRDGKPVIPGSSIKGTCRQAHEAITLSPPPQQERYKRRRPEPLSESGALFGALGYQGRVSFDDAVPPPGTDPVLVMMSVGYPPRLRKGRRFYGKLPEGADQPRTTPALALPRGIQATTALRLRNVKRHELGGVLLSLGIGRFTPRLGGGKYDDFGWVRFRARRFRMWHGWASKDVEWQEDDMEVTRFVDSSIQSFQPLPEGQRALDLLVSRLRGPDWGGK